MSARPIAEPIHLFDCVMPCAGAEALLVHPTDNQNPVSIGLWNNGGAADQKRVAGEDPVFRHDAHGIAGMAGRVQGAKAHTAHPQYFAIIQPEVRIGGG